MESKKTTINGFLNFYKSSGPTSMDAVREIKKLTGQRKRVGHGGTLDPLAEGVLPICFGQATRLMEYLVDSPKLYRMEVQLGVTTTTYDGEGEVVKQGDFSEVNREAVDEALKSFQGIIYQTPPMYSAIKRQGKRLYELARSGQVVDREARKVEVSRIEVLSFEPPLLSLDVESGRGAYMRSLAHDLGETLGCGGYLKSLVRLKSGPFRAEDGISLPGFQEAAEDGSWRQHIQPADSVLLQMKSVSVSKAAEGYIRRGLSVSLLPHVGAYTGYMEKCRAYTQDGRFLAVVSFDKPRNQWRPQKVFDLDAPSPHAPTAGHA